jgi:hypothetical protein
LKSVFTHDRLSIAAALAFDGEDREYLHRLIARRACAP